MSRFYKRTNQRTKMKLISAIVLVCFALIQTSLCQIHYVPAQILIPTINGTPIAAVNHTGYHPPAPAPQPGWNHWNPLPTYNYTKPGYNAPGYSNPGYNNPGYNNPGYRPPAPGYNGLGTYNSNSNVYRYNYSTNTTGPYNETSDGHLWVGTIQPFDRLLYNQEFFKDRRWWATREKIIEYPKDLPAGYSRHETISAIRCYNKFYDGNSARAEILDGGVGRQYVKIRLHSKWGYGFRYLVQIFGH